MVMTEFNSSLKLKNIELPELKKEGEIIAEVTAAGVCGSDAYMWHGHDPRTPLPIILGHEGVGRIKKIKGEKSSVIGKELEPGDPILWHRGVSCGRCYYCKIEKAPALCENRWVYGINRGCDEYPYLLGGYADHIVLSQETDIFKLPENVDHDSLVSVSCSGSTAAHAFDLAPVKFGDNVVIQGPGPLGIFGVVFAHYSGADEIIVIGGTPERLEVCKKAGATKIINRNKTSIEARRQIIMELTENIGADVVFEMVGSVEAVEEGIKLVKKGGTYASAGFGEPRGKIELDCFKDIGNKNVSYQGVWVSDVKHTFQALKIALKYQSILEEMTTHIFDLEDATKAIKKMDNKEAIKAVLKPQA